MSQKKLPKGCADRYAALLNVAVELRHQFTLGNKSHVREGLAQYKKSEAMGILALMFTGATPATQVSLGEYFVEVA